MYTSSLIQNVTGAKLWNFEIEIETLKLVELHEYLKSLFAKGVIGVGNQFCLGGLRSVARIFSPLLARNSSGFARMSHDSKHDLNILGRDVAAAPSPASYANERSQIHF